MKDSLLDFVRSRLEEGEDIAPGALARVLSAAREAKRRFRARCALLLAASLALACCGWLVHESASEHRESELSNIIALLRTVDGTRPDADVPLADSLLAWQDAPCLEIVN